MDKILRDRILLESGEMPSKRILSGFYMSPDRRDLLEEYPVTATGTFRLSVTFNIYHCPAFITFIQL